MSIHILADQHIYDGLKSLCVKYPELHFITCNSREQGLESIPACDAAAGWITEEMVHAGSRLRWVQQLSVGVEHLIHTPEVQERRIVLTNARIVMGPEIADHAFALLLALVRNMRQYINQMQASEWKPFPPVLPLTELDGRTLLVLGLGGIGVQVAERAAAFGMRVLGTARRDVPMMRSVEYIGKPDETRALLAQSDVVVCCLPATPECVGTIGYDELGCMPSGSYFINISRGHIVNTDALVKALQSGPLAGAGLDVTDPEPLPADHPLWHMPNVIITPHISGFSDGMERRRLELVLDNIERFMQGLPLKNVVEPDQGY